MAKGREMWSYRKDNLHNGSLLSQLLWPCHNSEVTDLVIIFILPLYYNIWNITIQCSRHHPCGAPTLLQHLRTFWGPRGQNTSLNTRKGADAPQTKCQEPCCFSSTSSAHRHTPDNSRINKKNTAVDIYAYLRYAEISYAG